MSCWPIRRGLSDRHYALSPALRRGSWRGCTVSLGTCLDSNHRAHLSSTGVTDDGVSDARPQRPPTSKISPEEYCRKQ